MQPDRIVLADMRAFAVRDSYPVSPGHTLIIPRRHVSSFFELSVEESDAVLRLLHSAKDQLQVELEPPGYNIGINDGIAAGQTVMHVHVHLIPRFASDSADPRGGIRNLFPEKAKYWER